MTKAATPPALVMGVALIGLLALLSGVDGIVIDMYLPGMPEAAADLGVPAGRIQQTVSIFLAGLALGQALYGPLLDRFGRRLPLLLGLAILALGSVAAALAPTVEWLLAACFLQALGASAGLVTPRAIVVDLYDVNESARIFSLLMLIMMVIPIVAPIAGGYLLGWGSWRLIFWALAGLSVAGCLLGLKVVPDSLPIEQRVPLRFGSMIRAYGRQLASPGFLLYLLGGGFVFSSLFIYVSMSSFVFTEHFQLTAVQFSYLFAVMSMVLVLGAGLSTLLLGWGLRPRQVMLWGICIHGLFGLLLYIAVQLNEDSLLLYAGLLAVAVGSVGLILGNLFALTMDSAGQQLGVASALMGSSHYLMSALVSYVVSLASVGHATLPLAIVICALLALSLCLLAQPAIKLWPATVSS